MNQQFFELPEEKQLRIVNSAMQVFGCNEYKRASTDLIAAKAGISKGLLFYYFHNKKELYMYCFDYCMQITKGSWDLSTFSKLTDFFDILHYGAEIKTALVARNPYITDFMIRSFYTEREDVSDGMKKNLTDIYSQSYNTYFSNVDMSKFKDDIDIKMIYNMLLWMGDGYLNEKRRAGQTIDYEETLHQFDIWMEFFRKLVYK